MICIWARTHNRGVMASSPSPNPPSSSSDPNPQKPKAAAESESSEARFDPVLLVLPMVSHRTWVRQAPALAPTHAAPSTEGPVGIGCVVSGEETPSLRRTGSRHLAGSTLGVPTACRPEMTVEAMKLRHHLQMSRPPRCRADFTSEGFHDNDVILKMYGLGVVFCGTFRVLAHAGSRAGAWGGCCLVSFTLASPDDAIGFKHLAHHHDPSATIANMVGGKPQSACYDQASSIEYPC
ncbi:hypothetical protein K523DRAFT_119850 [Schizophyllum commune Tattone D]|nr:hypothetical protein K523DRAFT_119850 [Schizophyllum commune Tattone D]